MKAACLFLFLAVTAALAEPTPGRFQLFTATTHGYESVFRIDTQTGHTWIYQRAVWMNGTTNELEARGWVQISETPYDDLEYKIKDQTRHKIKDPFDVSDSVSLPVTNTVSGK